MSVSRTYTFTTFAPYGVKTGSFGQTTERTQNAAALHKVRPCIIAEISLSLSNPKHGIIPQQAAHLDQYFLKLAASNTL